VGRIVVVNFVSIDGVIQSPLSPQEDPDGGFVHGGWVPPLSDDTVESFMQQTTVDASGMLLGRHTYEVMTEAWASADDSEPAVAAINRMPKYVVTSTLGNLPWQNSHRISGDLSATVADLRNRTEGELVVFGSGRLVSGLAAFDLVDEYRLLLFPVVLGDGKRMFDGDGQVARFALTSSVVASSGVVVLTYRRDRTA
jgi:dihydrofolate reductase